jgi:HEAT repeat protein/YHS domain-containing protein
MTTCPVCNKPVDPLRARFVSVRGGKIVPYCSAECRAAQDTKPTKLPEPAKPVEKPVEKPKAPPKPVPQSVEDLDSGPVIEILHEPASGVVTSAKDERVTQPTGKFAKEEAVEVKETIEKRKDGSKASGGADSAAVSGEVSERPRRPSGKHLTRERKDSTEAKAGWDWLEDEPADATNARPGTITESERRTRWPFVVLFVIVLMGGGGYLAWKYLHIEKAQPATEPPTVIDAAAAEATPDALVLTKEVALQQATDLLRKYLADGSSPRVQRLAAAALGRTGDPAAVTALQQGIKEEKALAARFKLAYDLARSGDKSAREILVTGLQSPQRSDKLDAAMHLAHLGDERAKPLLTSTLEIAQNRIQAAKELLRFHDPAAEKLLETIRTDPQSSAEEKATATLALYTSGKTELAGDVKKLLDNESWKAFAAYALGEMKDEAGKPVLVEQITNGVGVKVRAAWALKKLVGDASDDLLAPLHAAMGSAKDQEQIYAAEALLILAGDPRWSEYR